MNTDTDLFKCRLSSCWWFHAKLFFIVDKFLLLIFLYPSLNFKSKGGQKTIGNKGWREGRIYREKGPMDLLIIGLSLPVWQEPVRNQFLGHTQTHTDTHNCKNKCAEFSKKPHPSNTVTLTSFSVLVRQLPVRLINNSVSVSHISLWSVWWH